MLHSELPKTWVGIREGNSLIQYLWGGVCIEAPCKANAQPHARTHAYSRGDFPALPTWRTCPVLYALDVRGHPYFHLITWSFLEVSARSHCAA